MKEMTIEDIKTVSVDILSYFHEFCISNGLRYSLAYGSMIGAVRHKGIIPWDDDIDLWMPRPDYEKLFRLFRNNEDFAVFDYYHGGALQPYGRICDMKRTYVDTDDVPWMKKQPTGLYITIFPIDACEDELDSLQKRITPLKASWKQMFVLRSARSSLSFKKPLLKNVKILSKRILYVGQKVEKIIEHHIYELKRYNWDSSKSVCSFAYLGYKIKAVWDKHLFEEYVLVDFEGGKYYIAKGYDTILKSIYGDYMKLPPEEKRERRHTYNKFYWRD